MAAEDFATRLSARAAAAGVELTSQLTASLTSYYELLQRWNRTINLTSLTNEDEAIDRLLLEPVAAARHLPAPPLRLLDIGSGGGSPAIPMKLAVPAAVLTMVEARARKAAFLREAIRLLELSKTNVETARLEDIAGRPGWRGTWDVVSSRGVRIGPAEIEIVARLLRRDGLLVLFLSTPSLPVDLSSASLHDVKVEQLLPTASYLATIHLTGQ